MAEFIGGRSVIASELELEEFTRIGLRWIHYKAFKDRESVAAAVLECGLLNIPEGRRFGVDGVVILPEISFRKQEGAKGYSVRLKGESFKFNLEVPFTWRNLATNVSETREQLTFDIDCFIEGTILLSQISFEAWVTQTMHAIRRDYSPLLGG